MKYLCKLSQLSSNGQLGRLFDWADFLGCELYFDNEFDNDPYIFVVKLY